YTWSWSAGISKLSSAMWGFNSLESWLCRWDHVSDFCSKFCPQHDLLTIVPSPSHQLAFFILYLFHGLE
ncbi:hypothetical protein PWJ91_16370, partial [Enterobacter hormaechei]|nr:hypothetical protein [Enterobacter hormaechei]